MAKQESPEADEARPARGGVAVESSTKPKGRVFTRRRVLAGLGAATLGTAVFEYFSFRGAFDHRSMRVDGAAKFKASLAELEALSADERKTFDGVLHVGHSTHIVIADGVRFLTDPWFYDPAFGALKHEAGPAVDPANLEVDVILITHDHADHCDEKALARMPKTATCFVATIELVAKLKKCGFNDVQVLAPWESATAKGVTVHAVPGLHDIYEIGFVMVGAKHTTYFAGDSAIHPDLPVIAEKFAPHLSILPVDGTRVRGADLHVMRPEDAVEAALQLKSPMLMPSHAEARFYDPIAKYVLTENISKANLEFKERMSVGLPDREVLLPAPGELVRLDG